MKMKTKKQKPCIPSRKIPRNGYTGVANDIPGPGGYKPRTDYIKSKSSSALFSKSKMARVVFPVNKSKEEIPGP